MLLELVPVKGHLRVRRALYKVIVLLKTSCSASGESPCDEVTDGLK